MNNVKTYRDGARLILVVENCTGEVAAKVNRFVMDILQCDAAPEPTRVPAVVPEKPVDEPIPDVTKATPITVEDGKAFDEPAPEEMARNLPVEGISGTFGIALDRGHTDTVVSVYLQINNMEDSMRYTVTEMCKKYVREDCLRRTPECTNTTQIRKFFNEYKPLIGNELKFILSSSTYATVEDFLDFADEYQHQDAYRYVIEALLKRTSN